MSKRNDSKIVNRQSEACSSDTYSTTGECLLTISDMEDTSAPTMQRLLQLSIEGSNEVFISNAMLCFDQLTNRVNQQHLEIVQNLCKMLPQSVQTNAADTVSAPEQYTAGDSTSSGCSSTQFADTGSISSGATNVNASTTLSSPHNYRRLPSSPFNGVRSGGLSKSERYQRTRDVLKSSGLLEVAQNTSRLLKKAALLDKEIATFKAIINQHVAGLSVNSVQMKYQANSTPHAAISLPSKRFNQPQDQ